MATLSEVFWGRVECLVFLRWLVCDPASSPDCSHIESLRLQDDILYTAQSLSFAARHKLNALERTLAGSLRVSGCL